jgi:transcription initiation factor TFIID TATA-box-binding protein
MNDIHIENIVISTQIADTLNLNALSTVFEGSKYNPKEFPGLIVHFTQPKTAVLLFSSGKIICTGAKNMDEVHDALHKTYAKIKNTGVQLRKDYDITVQNIVASANIHCKLNLSAVSQVMGLENVEYEPEQFPGLIYRMDDPTAVMLLFGSGKMVITGAKTDEIEHAYTKMTEKLSSLGMLEK